MPVHIALLEDGGVASQACEFFRSPTFLRAEGVTHTLCVWDGSRTLALPLIVRPIPGTGLLDAVSPYGYPGATTSGALFDLRRIDLSALGLVSIFIRDRVGTPSVHPGRDRSTIFLHEPGRPVRVRGSSLRRARQNSRAGFRDEVLRGADVPLTTVAEFVACYRQTMQRLNARPRYRFSEAYLRACLAFEDSWLVVSRAPDGSMASSALTVRSDGHLHLHLGCTADAHLTASPSKNTYRAAIALADHAGLPLNLGGGLRPADGLEQFKRGFSNASGRFVTHEIVCARATYARLRAARDLPPSAGGDFFPRYRAGG